MKKLVATLAAALLFWAGASAQVIFSDGPDGGEYGDTPAKWTILQGNCCITDLVGGTALCLPPHSLLYESNYSEITPLTEAVLPAKYSIEFEFYMYKKDFDANNEFWMILRDGESTVLSFDHAIGAINSKCSYHCDYSNTWGTQSEVGGFYTVVADDWNQFKFTFDNGEALVFINGKKAATLTQMKAASKVVLASEQRYLGEERSNMRGTQFRNFKISCD